MQFMNRFPLFAHFEWVLGPFWAKKFSRETWRPRRETLTLNNQYLYHIVLSRPNSCIFEFRA